MISNLFRWRKDGGPDSPVDAFFVLEIKWLFTLAILKFNKGAREEFHSHAFNAITLFLFGDMVEEDLDGTLTPYRKEVLKLTRKRKVHRVRAHKTSWCVTIRGPWSPFWYEYSNEGKVKLTHGRKKVPQ